MDFSKLALQMIVLLIPGIIYMKIYRNLQACKEKKDWEDYFEMIFISIVCYLVYSLLCSINILSINPIKIDYKFKEAAALVILSQEEVKISFVEVFFASIISILLAYLVSLFKKMNIINKIGMFFKVTDRYGIEDLWYRFNIVKEIEWVTVRDYKANLDYYGYIRSYSESNDKRELIMENVTVFKDGTDTEYNINKLYVSREFDDLSLEYYDFGKKEVINDGQEC